MKSTELHQVVVDPSDATDEIMAAIREAVAAGGDVKITRRIWARLVVAKALHPLGVHHWVRYRTFDPASGRIIKHPGKWVCAECPKGKVTRA
jgi:hypothetical protein